MTRAVHLTLDPVGSVSTNDLSPSDRPNRAMKGIRHDNDVCGPYLEQV